MKITKAFFPHRALVTHALAVCVLAALFLTATVASAQSAPADPAHAPGWIVISVDDYQSLRSRAFPAEREPDPPPVDATLTRIDYDLCVTGDFATGRASLTTEARREERSWY
jgi:hypothetical protein